MLILNFLFGKNVVGGLPVCAMESTADIFLPTPCAWRGSTAGGFRLYRQLSCTYMERASAEDLVVSDAAPWWQTALRVIDAIAIALVVASAVMYVLHTYTDVFSEEKRKNRSSAKN